MSGFFALLIFVSLAALVLGFIKPSIVKMESRKKVMKIFIPAFLVSAVAASITAEESDLADEKTEEVEAEEDSVVEEDNYDTNEENTRENNNEPVEESANESVEDDPAENEANLEETEINTTDEHANDMTMEQENAVASAESYINYSAFSESGLIEQLEFEGYSADDATFAVQNITVDWSEQAILSAESYLDYSAFSKSGLIEQLEFEGFSNEDASNAVENIVVDWNEQAALSAESYLEYSSFSRSGLIEQLQFEGFTNEQATYGADAVGY
ncbi:Ltp family lipoprotein [Alkalicoccus chagannorensis]|uniref:Ltp family lipoprotein n=1 Tax=Alkalicoccus chagannorensis TaxID=427072 RepID=UPI000A03270C|nr:Ltp family lipoprotein [Alkalicoccus chagannorensis]